MTLTDDQLQQWLTPTIQLTEAAGRRILQIYASAFEVQQKTDKSPLTEADMASHEIISRGLHQLTPTIPVLSEESKYIDFAERQSWPTYWLIDPLDGTREFVKRNGEFAVNVALVHKHKVVLGIVYAPALNVLYYARRNGGAYKRQDQQAPQRIQTRRLGSGPIRIAGSRSHSSKLMEQYVARLGEHEWVSMGSSVKACLVAEGAVDVYPRFGPTSEWDTAAPQCIVEEAGGAVTDTEMQPLQYNTKAALTNPFFFAYGDLSRDWSQYLKE
jgi:3'(2'), 5'-bisphosphate nucleotidase